MNIAIVGATGAVGLQMIELLEKKNFPITTIKFLSSPRSAGKIIHFRGETYEVEVAQEESFAGIDIALFSAGGEVSKQLIPQALKHKVICIDNTNAFRMDPNVPLVVPEVNGIRIEDHKGIIANPNCSTIQMVMALKPIYDYYGIDRIMVSTYQSVSGAGNSAVQETIDQTHAYLSGKELEPKILPVASMPKKYSIAFNCLPQIDRFEENGFTLEEMKMVRETKKIFEDETLQLSATCVRVPVLYSHAESVYVECKKEIDLPHVRELLSCMPGLTITDDPCDQIYPLQNQAHGSTEVYVGRLRKDLNYKTGLHLWVVSDNLLKGAAWNAIQIMEYLIKKGER